MAQQKTASKANGKRRTTNKSMKKSAASRGAKSSETKASEAKSSDAKHDEPASGRSAGDDEVTIDRRRQDRRNENGQSGGDASASAPKLERRQKVNRRRQIDPTTCERDYTENEVEFMNALDEYKRKSGRMFPTCSEVLEVVRSLGYVKVGSSQLISCSAEPFVATPACEPIAAVEIDGSTE